MSDQFYAVQYRNMHTAIHEIAIFSLEQQAKDLLKAITRYEELHPVLSFEELYSSFVDSFEIDFHEPPYEYGGVELLYVNDPVNTIPDVY
jgi:hypothetical protein